MRPALTRSPTYVLTLVGGVIVAVIGWLAAVVLERTIVALSADLQDALRVLPEWMAAAPASVTRGGVVAALGLVNLWLIGRRHFRRLMLADAAFLAGLAASSACGTLLDSVLDPTSGSSVRLAEQLLGTAPTAPAMAGAIAMLVMVRQWLPPRVRPSAFATTALLLVTHLAIDGASYVGILLDVGTGMVAGSLVALALRTPNLQPDRDAIIRGLAASGLQVTDLWSADVDARGSEPWLGSTVDGRPLFVKALSPDQRSADLLFRAMRWLRLRRTGDAPPEVSLRRAAEHEALVAHHARSLGIDTPKVLAVVTVGARRVAIVYEGMTGRSLDKLPPESLTDEHIGSLWDQVRLLREHRLAHRDLRLANVMRTDDGRILLIDFGFAELAASQQLLDTDVAELLAATSAVLGESRAARLAHESLGADVLEQARDWLHPLAFSTATRQAITSSSGLEPLRAEVDRLTGHSVREYRTLGRLSPSHLLGLFLAAVGVYSLLALVAHDGIADHIGDIDWSLGATAIALGLLIPVLDALAYRSATGRRLPLRPIVRASYAAGTPVLAPTSWSFRNRVMSDAARELSVEKPTAKRAAADRSLTALVSAPLVVAGFAAAGLPAVHGQIVGIALGLLAGGVVAVASFALVQLTPNGRDFARVWIRPFQPRSESNAFLISTAGWSVVIAVVQGVAFALAARAAGMPTRFEVLVALGVATIAIAKLLPAAGELGAVEVLSFAGLSIGNDIAVAVLGAVLARIALFWAPLPIALWTYRSTRYHQERLGRADLDELPAEDPTVRLDDTEPVVTRSWWS